MELLRKFGEALRRPGISRDAVFQGREDVFAYYADPKDPTRIIQEAADGTKKVGRLVGEKFVEERPGT